MEMSAYLEPVGRISRLHLFPAMDRQARARHHQSDSEERHHANNKRACRQIGERGQHEPRRVSRGAEAVASHQSAALQPARGKRGNDQRGEHEIEPHELHRKGYGAGENEVEAAAADPAAQAKPEGEDRRRYQGDGRKLRRTHPQDLADEKILQMLGAVRIRGEEQDRRIGRKDERDPDHRLLHVGPQLFSPVEEERAGERRGQGGSLNRDALRLVAETVREDHPEPRDLRYREIDEHDATIEHLDAERRVGRRDEEPRDQRCPENSGIDGHLAIARRRASVSSYRPKRSFACSVPPTVYGRTTAGILARSASHSAGRGSLYAARTTATAGVRASWSSNWVRCAVLGGSPGLGSSAPTARMPSQLFRYDMSL